MEFFARRGHEMFLLSHAPLSPEIIADFEQAGMPYLGNTGLFHVKKFWLMLQDLNKVRGVLKQNRIDILHCHFLGVNSWYAALAQFHPLVVTVMGGDILGADWKPDRNLQEKFLTPYALKKADLITAWSPLLKKTVESFCPPATQVEVIHGGVHLDKFFPAEKPQHLRERLQIPANAKIVFSARLMRPLYNIEHIAQAANIVVEKFPDAYFVLAVPETIRDTEYAEQVRGIIEGGAARANTRYVETIPYEEIPDYFRLADVSVSIPTHDGTPMTVMESMACDTPTVMGNLADYDPFYFEHEKTTLMVDVKNPEAIAEAVLRLLRDEKLADEITLEARRRVESEGSYESQMSKMERLYEDLMSRRKAKKA
jgi:glycosyltransferase involved in cell wall biosynthesis